MKINRKTAYLLSNNNDGKKDGYETYMLSPEKSMNIMEKRVESVKHVANDRRNQNQVHEVNLKREEKLAQKSIDDMGGETSMKAVKFHLMVGYALLAACVLLWAGHFSFILWTFEPFGWDAKAYLIAFGVTVTIGILCERIFSDLERLMPKRYYLTIRLYVAIVGVTASILLGIYLAVIRADLSSLTFMTQEVGASSSSQSYEATVAQFYKDSFPKLLIALILFTIAIDIVTGLLLNLVLRKTNKYRPVYNQIHELTRIRQALSNIEVDNKRLEDAHEVYKNQFLEGISIAEAELEDWEKNKKEYRAKALIRNSLIVFTILILLFLAVNAMATTTVIALDLSKSVDHKDYVGTSEFGKNKQAISAFLHNIDVDSSIYILGITENSLGRPYHILTAKTSSKPGYFNELISRDKRKIQQEWMDLEGNLKPNAGATDIIGALYLAEAILKTSHSAPQNLLFFSDMRNTVGINLSDASQSSFTLTELSSSNMRIPDLSGVNVYVYGAHNGVYTENNWNKLMTFWREFFEKANANLIVYSRMREVSNLK